MYLPSLYRGVRLALFACLFAFMTSAVFAQSVALSGNLPPLLDSAQRLDRVAAQEQVSLALVLPLRNQDQLADLLHRLYTPGDLMYGKYLTSDQFAQQFSPTLADYNVVLAYAQAQGLTVTNTSPNRTVVDVAGSAQTVENAFGLQLNHYQVPGGRIFRAPSNEPQIPVQLVGRLAAVVGLDTAAVWKTHNKEKTAAAAGGHFLADPRQIGSGPGGGLAPSDIKTAYNLNAIGANGAGQTLGLFELDGYTASDISGYESYFSLPSVPLQNILVDSASGGAGSGAAEVTLDIELQIALAPAINKIYVYEGPNSNIGVIDTYNRIATDNLAKSVSTSWGLAESSNSSNTRNSENQAFVQMAAQGQSIFAAAGDSGADDNGSSLSVDDPASQPYMTGVGGTSLASTGAGGAWKTETTWNGGSINAGAGGGGVSVVWAKPSYQSTFGTSSTFRNVPDVSLDADPNTGYSIYLNGSWTIYGGTSCSAPLWSAFVACVNQSRVAAGKGTLGFANPLLYQLGASANYATDFHDIADNSTNLFYHATTGYDNATGWGSINGTGLFPDLVNGGPVGATNTSAVYQINSGGGGAVGTFSADTDFTGGTLSSTGQPINIAGVANAAPMAVYQTLRFGNFAYNLPNLTPGATYTVRLHFAENYFTIAGTGKRVFNVVINGVTALTNFDIFAAAGNGNTAIVEQFSTTADSTGKINITFTSVVNNAQINGLEILSGSGTGPTIPSAPTGLTATPGNAQVSLAWTTVSNATNYKVYRSLTSGSGYTSIGTATATNYVDPGLTNGTTYYYVVTAVNTAGESAQSSQASATPTAPITIPSAPTGLTATPGNAQVSLAWTTVSNATNYKVYRSLTSGSGYTSIGTATATNYVDPGLTNGTTYYYVVTAVNTAGESAQSSQASATPTAPSTALAAVYQINSGGGGAVGTFSADTDFTGGTLSSTGQPINIAGVANAAPMAVYQTLRFGNFAYNLPNLTPGATYTVRLHFAENYFTIAGTGKRVFNVVINGVTALTNFDIFAAAGNGNTAIVEQFSTTADSTGKINITFTSVVNNAQINGLEILSGSGTGPTIPSAPTGLTATPGNAQVSLAWTTVSNATNYKVYRSLTSGSGYTSIGTATATNYVDPGLTNGTTYYYVVTAVNTAGESAQSSQASATPTAPITIPSAPTGLTATPGNAQVSLAWTTVSNATNYKVYRSLTSGSGYTSIGTATATNYVDPGLTNGTTYYYVVTAVNTAGESAQSSQASATPTAPSTALVAVYQINSGGGGAVGTFSADTDFTGGTLSSTGQPINIAGVANAAPMAVYQTLRFGNFAYNLPNLTPGATYTVRLHFAENYFTIAGTGKRVFNVVINGVTALTNFDIFAAAGNGNTAIVEQFSTTADSTGKINITFTSVVNNAQINGLEILH